MPPLRFGLKYKVVAAHELSPRPWLLGLGSGTREVEATIDQNVEVVHQIEHIRRTIIDPKAVTVQAAPRLITKAPTLEPEPKADLGGLYE
jgi:hypothetical protein